MAGLGALVRAIRGIAEGQKLKRQIDEVEDLVEDDVLSLVPEPFRPCAILRLRVAEGDIAPAENRGQLEKTILERFDDIRKAGLEKMMEQASKEQVTRDEMIRLFHTLEEYAKASGKDIAALDSQTKGRLHSLHERLTEYGKDVDSARHQLNGQRTRLMALSDLPAKMDRIESQSVSAAKKLQASMRGLRMWLLFMGALSALELGCVIYLLVR